jgi:hypothetical protein
LKCNKQSYDKKEVGKLDSWEVKVEKDDKMVISLLGEFEKVRMILNVLGREGKKHTILILIHLFTLFRIRIRQKVARYRIVCSGVT